MPASDHHDLSRLPLDGLTAEWIHEPTCGLETLRLRFENEAWTAEGLVSDADIQYVFRFNASWHLQQMLLFRDMDDPDLWLANDGRGRWGEVNGAVRRELGGCTDIDLLCSAFTRTMSIRRLALEIGQSADVESVTVDSETLAVERARLDYTRLGARNWVVPRDDGRPGHEFVVDDYGLPLDLPGHFRRVA
ncbi:MAG: putative glycolipid-binding domain-containing protein [Actinomycetota bacterium]